MTRTVKPRKKGRVVKVYRYLMEDEHYYQDLMRDVSESGLILEIVEGPRPSSQTINQWVDDMYGKG